MGSWDQNLHVLEHLATHFGSPNQSYQAPTVTQMPKIYLLENFRRSDQNVHFREPNIRENGNTHQNTKMYIFRRKYILSPRKKKYVLHFRKIYAEERKLVI